MVYFNIVLSRETKGYLGLLVLVLFLLFLAVAFVGMMLRQLVSVVRTQNKLLAVRNRGYVGEEKKE